MRKLSTALFVSCVFTFYFLLFTCEAAAQSTLFNTPSTDTLPENRFYMEANFIVLTVNSKKVKSLEELTAAIFEAQGEVTIDGFYEEYEGQYSYVFNKD